MCHVAKISRKARIETIFPLGVYFISLSCKNFQKSKDYSFWGEALFEPFLKEKPREKRGSGAHFLLFLFLVSSRVAIEIRNTGRVNDGMFLLLSSEVYP